MQLRNREADDFVGSESQHAVLDFPTEEEWLVALEAGFAAASSSPSAAKRAAASQRLVADQELAVEPEFMLDFAAFLLARLQRRTYEMRQAQGQLSDELARLRLGR